VASGENTWPKFAAMLRARKAVWQATQPNEDNFTTAQIMEAGLQVGLYQIFDAYKSNRPEELEKEFSTAKSLASHRKPDADVRGHRD
jgi:hypothetical protein